MTRVIDRLIPPGWVVVILRDSHIPVPILAHAWEMTMTSSDLRSTYRWDGQERDALGRRVFRCEEERGVEGDSGDGAIR